MRSSWMRVDNTPVTGALTEVRETQTQRRSHVETEAEMARTHHTPRATWSPRSWKRQEGVPPEPVAGAQPCPAWTSEPCLDVRALLDLRHLVSGARAGRFLWLSAPWSEVISCGRPRA